MHLNDQTAKLTIRVPQDVKGWLTQQTRLNASSHASEIVRAVRERMERTEKRNEQKEAA